MATRERSKHRATRLVEAELARIGADLRQARVSAGLSLRVVGGRVGVSPSQISRIERGLAPSATHRQTSMIGAVVGLDVRTRTFPNGDPLRDAGQRSLIERLRPRLHVQITFRTEVPLPIVGDRRAWDGWLSGLRGHEGSTLPVEAETHISDWQALERRLALKQRDAGAPHLLLLVADTRHNRAVTRAAAVELASRFPVTARRALAALDKGEHPGGSALILL